MTTVELVLVGGFAVGWELTRSGTSTTAQLVLVALAATAMGLQGAAIRAAFSTGVSTTYLTGTLTGVVMALASGRRLADEWTGVAVLAAAFTGAALAGTALYERSALAPVVPLIALAGARVVGRTAPGGESPLTPDRGSRTDAG